MKLESALAVVVSALATLGYKTKPTVKHAWSCNETGNLTIRLGFSKFQDSDSYLFIEGATFADSALPLPSSATEAALYDSPYALVEVKTASGPTWACAFIEGESGDDDNKVRIESFLGWIEGTTLHRIYVTLLVSDALPGTSALAEILFQATGHELPVLWTETTVRPYGEEEEERANDAANANLNRIADPSWDELVENISAIYRGKEAAAIDFFYEDFLSSADAKKSIGFKSKKGRADLYLFLEGSPPTTNQLLQSGNQEGMADLGEDGGGWLDADCAHGEDCIACVLHAADRGVGQIGVPLENGFAFLIAWWEDGMNEAHWKKHLKAMGIKVGEWHTKALQARGNS
jgi:hypothetical protein